MMRVAARKGPSFVRPIRNPSHHIMIGAPSSTASRHLLVQVAPPDGRSRSSSNQPREQHKQHAPTRVLQQRTSHSSNNARLTANVLFAVAAVASLRPIMTMAEGRTTANPQENEQNQSEKGRRKPQILQYANGKACPLYGCPLYPLDIVPEPPKDPYHNGQHAPESLEALEEIRTKTRTSLSEDHQNTLDTTARSDMATLTMTGFKGGPTSSQINQDRALAVGPYWIGGNNNNNNKNKEATIDNNNVDRRLIGVFDGHAARGEIVSEYVVKELPNLLAKKLRQALDDSSSSSSSSGPADDEVSITKRVLHETFVELDETAPANPSGGCTASVVLLQGDNVYVANAGDSQSFVAIYHKATNRTKILYASREDKPHVPEEKKRVEDLGGRVYIPVRGTSRVIVGNTGLAMSRSLGDWQFGKLVIPDPLVDVINIPEAVTKELELQHAQRSECWLTDDDGVVTKRQDIKDCEDWEDLGKDEVDDVYIFAVSATDGMLDYVSLEGMANLVALSLFEEEAVHPATACEILVSTAAEGWKKYRQGRYRDDIAISVTALRIPPPESSSNTVQKKEDSKEETSPEKDEL